MRTVRGLLIGYGVIALLTGWPIASVAIAGLIATWNGCALHEGAPSPCIVAGRDIGGALYSMGVLGWFMLATIPIALVAFLLWSLGWVLWRIVTKRRERPAGP